MLLYSGNTTTLAGREWVAVEFSDSRTEEVVLHVTRWCQRSLGRSPWQLLFPVQSRDIDGVKLIAPYLLIRTTNNTRLAGVKTVMGVEGLLDDGNGKPLPIEDKWAQRIIRQSRDAWRGWSAKIGKGDWARILLGERRMLVGRIRAMHGDIADVRVSLRSRELGIRIHKGALLNLGSGGAREYYGNLS